MIEMKRAFKQYKGKDAHGRPVSVDAVKPVSLTLDVRTRYALVGESGSGKSTLARMLMAIEPPSGGDIWLDGKSVKAMKPRELRLKRAVYQMVLQNARSALDPRRRVYDSIAEPIRCLMKMDRREERRKVAELAERMQLSAELLDRLPHELSGGQLKRVCLARAMSVSPAFIVFDEAVSGLDVMVRNPILDLILQLRHDGLGGFLFITHDIDVALYMADHIFVMKDGEIVERIEHAASYADFRHDYSRLLIESIPSKWLVSAGGRNRLGRLIAPTFHKEERTTN